MSILGLLLALSAAAPAAASPRPCAQDVAPPEQEPTEPWKAAEKPRAQNPARRADDEEKPRATAPERPLVGAAEWQPMVARERRIGFTARTPTDARAELDKEGLPAERRAVAWLALGAARSLVHKKRIEELARDGEGAEREA